MDFFPPFVMIKKNLFPWAGSNSSRINQQGDVIISVFNTTNTSTRNAKKDYQKYKEEFTFDRLCASLGNVFMEFLELYQKGRGREIIDKLNVI